MARQSSELAPASHPPINAIDALLGTQPLTSPNPDYLPEPFLPNTIKLQFYSEISNAGTWGTHSNHSSAKHSLSRSLWGTCLSKAPRRVRVCQVEGRQGHSEQRNRKCGTAEI